MSCFGHRRFAELDRTRRCSGEHVVVGERHFLAVRPLLAWNLVEVPPVEGAVNYSFRTCSRPQIGQPASIQPKSSP